MTTRATRSFTDMLAVREKVPLIVGLVGPTGSGKTGSALELATGLQDVQGGEIGVVDSEARRALAYADEPLFSEPTRKFKFRHLDFKAPFGPMDYIDACEHMIKKGVKHLVVDSTSHMWEGTGGILQSHEAEVERLMKAWNKQDAKDVTFAAWNKGKTEQTAFVNWMKQQPVNFLFCFRAKEKMKMINNKPTEVGWQAIGGEDLLYEMSLACLLRPECDGQPIWNKKDEMGVKALHAHFRPMFASNPRLSAAVGRQLAEWGKGKKAAPAPASPQAEAPAEATKPKPEIQPAATSDGKSEQHFATAIAYAKTLEELKDAYSTAYKSRADLTAEEMSRLDKLKEEVKVSLTKPL